MRASDHAHMLARADGRFDVMWRIENLVFCCTKMGDQHAGRYSVPCSLFCLRYILFGAWAVSQFAV